MDTRWSIQLLGGLRAVHGDRAMARLRTRKMAALLAYLAYHRRARHPRSVLIEMFWPDVDPDAGRKSLSVALSALRAALEPPGVAPGSVLIADRYDVQLNPSAIVTDVAAFDAALRAADRSTVDSERIDLLTQAVMHWRGPLLPGFYDGWIPAESARLTAELYRALTLLGGLTAGRGDSARAAAYLRRAIETDPLREDAYRTLMQLYAEEGRAGDAMRLYADLEAVLRRELNTAPNARTQALLAALRERAVSEQPAREHAGRQAEPVAQPAPPVARNGARVCSRVARIPTVMTRFFGREDEIERILDAIACGDVRLITLTGPAGSGKTRLAVEAARRLDPTLAGNVWFVSLADLRDAGGIPDRILAIMGMCRGAEQDPMEQLTAALSVIEGRGLLILDNFEQIVEAGAGLVADLLARGGNITLLITSRQRLNLSSEREYPVKPLPVPCDCDPFERLIEMPSVQLFADRASAARADFCVTPENAGTVAALCRRLAGIPLAIELASARAQILTPVQMLAQLDSGLDCLVSRLRDVEERHRTLRGAIDWSFQLLPERLQRFFVRLSVFRGGCTLAAAEQVCAERSDTHTALDALSQLRECSLLHAEERNGQMRYRLLDILQEYTRDHLSPTERDGLRARHARWFLALAEAARPELYGPDQAAWIERLEAEHDNIRAALEWLLAAGDGEAALRLAAAMERFWYLRGYIREGYDWLSAALRASKGAPYTRASALRGVGILLRYLGEYVAAEKALAEAVCLFEEAGDLAGVADALRLTAVARSFRGECASAQAIAAESLAAARKSGDAWVTAAALQTSAGFEADPAQARARMEESVKLFTELADPHGIGYAHMSLGRLAQYSGDLDRAQCHAETSLHHLTAVGSAWSQGETLILMGDIAEARKEYDRARVLYEQSLTLFRAAGIRCGTLYALGCIGSLAAEQGDFTTARHYLQQSLDLLRDGGNRPVMAYVLQRLAHAAEGQGDAEAAARFREEAREMGTEE